MKNNLIKYLASIKNAKKLLNEEILTLDEFKKYDAQLMKKYCIKPMNIYRTNDLINKDTRANM